MGLEYKNSKLQSYFLHKKDSKGKLFFFCKEVRKEFIHCELPKDFEIVENNRTKFPMVRRKK